jgi:sulfur carrier protein
MSGLIAVEVNGEERQLDTPATVESLVEAIGCGRRGVAVAVDSDVVPRSLWSSTPLQGGERIEVLQAVQGG